MASFANLASIEDCHAFDGGYVLGQSVENDYAPQRRQPTTDN